MIRLGNDEVYEITTMLSEEERALSHQALFAKFCNEAQHAVMNRMPARIKKPVFAAKHMECEISQETLC